MAGPTYDFVPITTEEILANHFQWLQDGIALNSIFLGNPQVLYTNLEKAFKQLYHCIKR